MIYTTPVTQLIQNRFSCRSYLEDPIPAEKQQKLREILSKMTESPFQTPMRFELFAANEPDRKGLRSLGTYGFIQGATAFIIGTVCKGPKYLEDYGYRLEEIILYATELGLGTCWLGGTFTKSTFALRMKARSGERMPAVVSMGLISDEASARQTNLRKRIGAERRKPWESLFFDGGWDKPLSREEAGPYETPLEMVRLGPSASNKQPWRVVRADNAYHFYIQRSRGYRNPLTILVGVDDMQRLDIGIAMCHFEQAAREMGLKGAWSIQDPGLEKPDGLTEYSVSWG